MPVSFVLERVCCQDAYRYLAQRRSDVAQSALEGAALTRWQCLVGSKRTIKARFAVDQVRGAHSTPN
eukprot:6488929-Amphidinium_carterae.1